jgi:hypothetical protein
MWMPRKSSTSMTPLLRELRELRGIEGRLAMTSCRPWDGTEQNVDGRFNLPTRAQKARGNWDWPSSIRSCGWGSDWIRAVFVSLVLTDAAPPCYAERMKSRPFTTRASTIVGAYAKKDESQELAVMRVEPRVEPQTTGCRSCPCP